jgi:hypothetical protein
MKMSESQIDDPHLETNTPGCDLQFFRSSTPSECFGFPETHTGSPPTTPSPTDPNCTDPTNLPPAPTHPHTAQCTAHHHPPTMHHLTAPHILVESVTGTSSPGPTRVHDSQGTDSASQVAQNIACRTMCTSWAQPPIGVCGWDVTTEANQRT